MDKPALTRREALKAGALALAAGALRPEGALGYVRGLGLLSPSYAHGLAGQSVPMVATVPCPTVQAWLGYNPWLAQWDVGL